MAYILNSLAQTGFEKPEKSQASSKFAHQQSLSNESPVPPENRLLAALPRDEYERLVPSLDFVRLPRNRILHEAGDTIHHAYFLNSGMASVLAITEEGRTIELGVVGSDGYVGVPLIHDVDSAAYRVMVQTPST